MVEEEEIVRMRIPPLVRDETVIEVPIRGLGIHNFYLRLYIRVTVSYFPCSRLEKPAVMAVRQPRGQTVRAPDHLA